jgi:hypothetical protein
MKKARKEDNATANARYHSHKAPAAKHCTWMQAIGQWDRCQGHNINDHLAVDA